MKNFVLGAALCVAFVGCDADESYSSDDEPEVEAGVLDDTPVLELYWSTKASGPMAPFVETTEAVDTEWGSQGSLMVMFTAIVDHGGIPDDVDVVMGLELGNTSYGPVEFRGQVFTTCPTLVNPGRQCYPSYVIVDPQDFWEGGQEFLPATLTFTVMVDGEPLVEDRCDFLSRLAPIEV